MDKNKNAKKPAARPNSQAPKNKQKNEKQNKIKKIKTKDSQTPVKTKQPSLLARFLTKEQQEKLNQYAYIIFALTLLCFVGYAIDQSLRLNNKQIQQQQNNLTISYNGRSGKTVLEILKENHNPEIEETSGGSFVNSINGKKNTSNSFWVYYVNGKQGTVASDQYETKDEDKVEWKYEKFE
jgi:hypothetical protein